MKSRDKPEMNQKKELKERKVGTERGMEALNL